VAEGRKEENHLPTLLASILNISAQHGRVPKWLKSILGLLLVPVCWAGAVTLWRVLQATGHADTFWVAFLAGAACWVVVYVLLPKPLWLYVLGHELTHVLWTWLFWGRVKKFKASGKGGQVIVTKSNFLISLAPYFFPLYAVIVVLVFIIGNKLSHWQSLDVFFHLLLGASYAFHIILTCYALRSHQTDVSSQGFLFSAAVIFLGNITVLLVSIPLLTGIVDVQTVFRWWGERIFSLIALLAGGFRNR
jgi:hypothetical protein